jgi:tetratricopeptide (TPR) repeat protein
MRKHCASICFSRFRVSRNALAVVGVLSCVLWVAPSSAAEAENALEVDSLSRQVIELYRAGKYQEAIPIAWQLLGITEKSNGAEHPSIAGSLNNLAALYKETGDYATAEPLYQRALVIREKALGPEHPDIATSLNNLAVLYNSTGTYAKAEPLYRRALAIREKALGPEHSDTATSF